MKNILILLPILALLGCSSDPPDTSDADVGGGGGTGGEGGTGGYEETGGTGGTGGFSGGSGGGECQANDWQLDEERCKKCAPDPTLCECGPVRVVTFNCWNLFDNIKGNCAGGWCPEEPSPAPTLAKYTEKLNGIANVLKVLDGDIVLLQEVEHIGILTALANHPDLARKGYNYRDLRPGNDPRGINIGVMSRMPFESYITHKTDEFSREDNPTKLYKFARDAAEVRLTIRMQKVAIVGMHLKAKADTEDPDRRVAEGQQLRRIADNIKSNEPDRYIIIAGDMNDTPDSVAYSAVINGVKPGGLKYVAASDLIPEEKRFSYVYKNEPGLIDHIIADPFTATRIIENSVVITSIDRNVSDHAALAATYLMGMDFLKCNNK